MLITGRLRGKARNIAIFTILSRIAKSPGNDLLLEEWAYISYDMVRVVSITQFASVQKSPDFQDIEQAAVFEFLRSVNKFAKLTLQEDMSPTRIFRILYSVARYSMIRELTKIRKHAAFVDIELDKIHEDEVSTHNVHSFCDFERKLFISDYFPKELIAVIDDSNIYKNTKWNKPIIFCVAQLLRGRRPSFSLLGGWFGIDGQEEVVTYSQHLIKMAVLRLSTQPSIRQAVSA